MKRYNAWGFTVVELLVTLVVIGIVSTIAVPTVLGVIENTKSKVCRANQSEVERLFERHLLLVGVVHTEIGFQSFLLEFGRELCPVGGEYHYVNGEVECSEHLGSESGEEDEENGVSYL